MKPVITTSLLVAAALVTGCVSQQRGLVLDPIGPRDSQSAAAGSNRTLVVFPAFDPHARPEPTRETGYAFEYDVTEHHPDDSTTKGAH